MATNYTQHYHLPQWAADDHVLRDEFNQAWADVDAGLEAAARYPYAVGTYTGNGGELAIDLGFRPRFLHITGTISNYSSYGSVYMLEAATGGEQAVDVVQLTDTGFTVFYTLGSNGKDPLYPMVNQNGRAYSYIAFR